MSTQEQDLSLVERNVQFIRDHVTGSGHKMDVPDGMSDVSADQFDYFSDETIFYFNGRDYRGKAGVQAFIDILAPYHVRLGDIIDIYGSEDRVTLVIDEQLERISDGEVIDYVRTATYKVKDGVILECWLVDAPPVELANFMSQSA